MCYREDANVCYSFLSQNSFLLECLLDWSSLIYILVFCLMDDEVPLALSQDVFCDISLFSLFINGLLPNVFREGYGCVL